MDSDDEDFVINYTEEERVPVSASDTSLDESLVPIPITPPEVVPVEDSEIREEDQVEDSEVLEETTNEDMNFYDDEDDEAPGDVLETPRPKFKYRSAHPQDLII